MSRQPSVIGSLSATQGPAFAVVLLFSVIVGGALGYHFIQGYSIWHAFYVTVLAVTTVNLPDGLTRSAQAFTVVLLFAGVGSALYTFTLLATVVVEGWLPKRLQKRRQERMLETIRDHFIVCGYGRIGSIVAHEFRRQGIPHVIVEADASREEVLKRVGIDRARGLIAAVGTDAENVYAVLSARVMRPDLFIVGRAETEDATHK